MNKIQRQRKKNILYLPMNKFTYLRCGNVFIYIFAKKLLK